MDGTLVDSTEMVEQVWTEFSEVVGADPTTVIAYAHGRPSRATIAKFAPHEAAKWEAFIHLAEETRFGDSIEIPGAAAFTHALPRGRWAVVTSALREPARERLIAVGIDPPEVLIGAQDVVAGKPDPEGYRAAARLLGYDPRDCVVFEDTDAGISAGLAAGCQVVSIGSMHSSHTRVQGQLADLRGVKVELAGAEIVITRPPLTD